jgi:hypothetical protein
LMLKLRRCLLLIAIWLVTAGFTVKLSWNDNSNNEDGFIIEHKGRNGGWKEHSRVGRDVTTAFVTIEETSPDRKPKKDCFRIRSFILPAAIAKPSNEPCVGLNERSENAIK